MLRLTLLVTLLLWGCEDTPARSAPASSQRPLASPRPALPTPPLAQPCGQKLTAFADYREMSQARDRAADEVTRLEHHYAGKPAPAELEAARSRLKDATALQERSKGRLAALQAACADQSGGLRVPALPDGGRMNLR